MMSLILLINAREREYGEKLHTSQTEMVKKRGRAGMAICFILAFAFLSEDLLKFLYKLFDTFPEPAIIINYVDEVNFNTLDNAQTLNIGEKSIFFAISLFSLISFLLIIIGIYLMFFNKFILHSKLKFLHFLVSGLTLWAFFGFRTSLRLMI